MTSWLPILPYLVFWAVAMQAILVRAKLVPPICARCGRTHRRRFDDQSICSCPRKSLG